MTHNQTGPACGNNPNQRMSDGDRRVVDEFKAYLTDRAALRDRIAQALYEHNHPGWATRYVGLDQDERDTYLARAAAVLAVVPPPADRAAVLREAADALWNHPRASAIDSDFRAASDVLHRLADEEQPEKVPGQVTLNRDQLAALLAHHADVIAASLHADARSGLPELRAGVERATELLTLHANALTAEEETPAVAELLDSILTFPTVQPAAEPTPLRWGLNDVMWGDDDTITVMLSGPTGEPYWLELDPDRAAVLRQDLAGPDDEEQPTTRRRAGEEPQTETEAHFGGGDCTCTPWTHQDGKPRYCVPGDTVDRISGWERGRDCPHHPAAVAQPGKET